MENPDEIFPLLPRHIRKLVKSKMDSPDIYSVNNEGGLNLHNTYSMFGSVGTDENFNVAPDHLAMKLKNELASYEKINPNQICIGNGGDELMDLVIRTFCNPHEDKILCFSGGNHRILHHARMNAVEVEELNLEGDFELPVFDIKRAITEYTKVIFIENPNQVVGKCYASFDIVDLAVGFDGIVVIDESAIDYASDKSLLSMVELCSNVIIIQSFCRAWGFAGLPLGIAYSQKPVISVLNLIKPPFSVNVMTQRMAVKALYVSEQKDRIVQKTIEEREQVKSVLQNLPLVKKVYDSQSNTLLIQVENSEEFINYLKNEEQILVFDASHIKGFENCVRITIGPGINNMRLVKAIKDMPRNTSAGHLFWRSVGRTLKKASMYLGVFRKMFGTGT
jgi:histidinol-phosphate aminotransferase